MNYSNDFKINVNKLNSDELVLILLEITHPFLAQPLRFVRDNRDLVSNSNNFMAMNFDLQRQDDSRGELPKVTLTIPNIGRSLVKWIDSSNGGVGTQIKIMLARRSTPDVIEETLSVGIERVSITTELVTFSLVVQNNLIKRSMKYLFDTNKAPGLF